MHVRIWNDRKQHEQRSWQFSGFGLGCRLIRCRKLRCNISPETLPGPSQAFRPLGWEHDASDATNGEYTEAAASQVRDMTIPAERLVKSDTDIFYFFAWLQDHTTKMHSDRWKMTDVIMATKGDDLGFAGVNHQAICICIWHLGKSTLSYIVYGVSIQH